VASQARCIVERQLAMPLRSVERILGTSSRSDHLPMSGHNDGVVVPAISFLLSEIGAATGVHLPLTSSSDADGTAWWEMVQKRLAAV